jgi:hypothetical protein
MTVITNPYPPPQSPPAFRRVRTFLSTQKAWVGLGLCLLGFWIYKFRDLTLPYFWDELGVYGRAAVYLHDHTLGLLPSHLPPELSRGHPLLLMFTFGALFRVFGATPLVAHLFSMCMATGLLVSVFWIARRHWNSAVGLAAAVLLAVQPLFLAQSTLLLPELPLALVCLWAMYFFTSKHYLWASICLSLAIFIKETALVLEVVLGVMLLVEWLRSRPSLKSALAGVMALAIPVLIYGGFLLIQKRQNGWYFFPLHENHVNFRWLVMKGKLWDYLQFLFMEQGRFALSVIVSLWLTLRLFEKRQPRFVASLAWTFGLFIVGILVFSAGNFFMKRYLLCLLPPFAILASRALYELGREQVQVLAPAVAILVILALGEIASPRFNYDYDMSFRETVLLQKKATTYVENTLGTDKPILTVFPPIFGLEDPRYGYAKKKFKRYSHLYFPEAEYIFVSEVMNRYTPPPGVRTELIQRFSSPYITFLVYRILR